MAEQFNQDDGSPPPYVAKVKEHDEGQAGVEPQELIPNSINSTTKSTDAKDATKTASQSTVYFAFGPHNTYCLRDRSIELRYAALGIQDVTIKNRTCLALGELPRFFIAGIDEGGAPSWHSSLGPATRQSLRKAKKKKTELALEEDAAKQRWDEWTAGFPLTVGGLEKVTVAFGQGTSYIACGPHGCVWHHIPHGMEEAIKSKLPETHPKLVTLGYGGAYCIIWPDKTLSYNLCDQYPQPLNDMLSSGRTPVAYISLNPWRAGDYYVEAAGGNILCWNPLRDQAGMSRLQAFTAAMMQRRAKQDGVTFKQNTVTNSGTSSRIISPETNHVFDLTKEQDRMAQTKGTTSNNKKLKYAAGGVIVGTLCNIM